MPELSLHHIEQVQQDILKEEIFFSHLFDDLVDHVCCDVEYEMQQGLSFHEAYQKVKTKMSPQRYKEIQKETLYAVDSKYRNMKKAMKFSGITGTILLAFAAFFKIQHWPMAGVMLVIGAFILAFIFMPSALNVLWKETHNKKRIFNYILAFITALLFITGIVFKVQHWNFAGAIITLSAISGILIFIPSLLFSSLTNQEDRSKRKIYILGAAGLVFYIAGLLFKIQHWPLATICMLVGLADIFIVVFPWYTWVSWKDENYVSSRFIFMVIGALSIVLPSTLITMNLQSSYEAGFYQHQEQNQELFRNEFRYNQAILKPDSISSPILTHIHSSTDSLLSVIDGIESKMISLSEGNQEISDNSSQVIISQVSGPRIRYDLLKRPFNASPVINFLGAGSSTRKELETALKNYTSYLSSAIAGEDARKYDKLLDPLVYFPDDAISEGRFSLMAGLHSLGLLKNSILVVESNAFLAVSNH